MIEIAITEHQEGRFEVEVPGCHHEAFAGRFGAVCAAYALEEELRQEGWPARMVYPSIAQR